MPLIKCPDCGTEVSDSAAKCPKCARPIAGEKPAALTPVQAASKSVFGVVRILVITALLLIILITGAFIYTNRHLKNTELTGMPILTTWNHRAEADVKRLLDTKPDIFAKSIQGITHPTGEKPQLASYNIREAGENISVRMDVKWHGGLMGSEYLTTVVWEFNKQNHLKTTVLNDTASIAIDSRNLKKLDDYFSNEIYPVVSTNAH